MSTKSNGKKPQAASPFVSYDTLEFLCNKSLVCPSSSVHRRTTVLGPISASPSPPVSLPSLRPDPNALVLTFSFEYPSAFGRSRAFDYRSVSHSSEPLSPFEVRDV